MQSFYHFAENNSFQYHVRLYVTIRIAEFLYKYDVKPTVDCQFNEFGYEIVTMVNSQPLSMKFRYGTIPSERQMKQFSSFIGRHISDMYDRYCEENDND